MRFFTAIYWQLRINFRPINCLNLLGILLQLSVKENHLHSAIPNIVITVNKEKREG